RDGKLNVPIVILLVETMIIMFGSCSVAFTLATLTYSDILKTTTLSLKHRTMQYTLLAAVCTQTFVPVVCVYIPYFLAIICPFLSIPVFGLSRHFLQLLAIFPGWDAIVIIAMIKDYRIGLMRIMRQRKMKNAVQVSSQYTTATQ
ncbi:hypothetical protein PMAYCL1PPCAC_16313, partial [Pristionchus mayeri]